MVGSLVVSFDPVNSRGATRSDGRGGTTWRAVLNDRRWRLSQRRGASSVPHRIPRWVDKWDGEEYVLGAALYPDPKSIRVVSCRSKVL